MWGLSPSHDCNRAKRFRDINNLCVVCQDGPKGRVMNGYLGFYVSTKGGFIFTGLLETKAPPL